MLDETLENLLVFGKRGYQIAIDIQGIRAWDIAGDGTKCIYQGTNVRRLFDTLDAHYAELVENGEGRH